jgi:hypothetical protein
MMEKSTPGFHNLYSSPAITRVLRSWRISARNEACIKAIHIEKGTTLKIQAQLDG